MESIDSYPDGTGNPVEKLIGALEEVKDGKQVATMMKSAELQESFFEKLMGGGGETPVRNTFNNPTPQVLSEDNLNSEVDDNIQPQEHALSDNLSNQLPYFEATPMVMSPSVEDDMMDLQNFNHYSPDNMKEELKVEEEYKKPATHQTEESKNGKKEDGFKFFEQNLRQQRLITVRQKLLQEQRDTSKLVEIANQTCKQEIEKLRGLLALLNPRDSTISRISSTSAQKKGDGPEEEKKSMPKKWSSVSSEALADTAEMDPKKKEAIGYLKKMIPKI